jgi:hypothetical protein
VTPYVVGIDPGNDSAGIAFLYDGAYSASETRNPWSGGALWMPPRSWLAGPEARAKVFVEVPQNGTHKSRGGVHFAAGLIVGQSALEIRRQDVIKVTPREWRTGLGLEDRGMGKGYFVAQAQAHFPSAVFDSDDEAEACLIALYGYRTLLKGKR